MENSLWGKENTDNEICIIYGKTIAIQTKHHQFENTVTSFFLSFHNLLINTNISVCKYF